MAAGTVVFTKNGARLVQKMLAKTGLTSMSNMKRRITIQTGMTDNLASDVTEAALLKGDLVYDSTNDDWYICTVTATTCVQISV